MKAGGEQFVHCRELHSLECPLLEVPRHDSVAHRTEQVCVPLRNPLDHSVVFSCQCSNTRHFIIPALTDSQVHTITFRKRVLL